MNCTADLETQAVASLLAFAFNDAVGRASPFKVKFLGAKAVVFPAEARGKTRSDGDRLEVRGQLPVRWMSMEKRFRGEVEMERYTNNAKYVRRVSEEDARTNPRLADKIATAVAFSHYTFVASREYLMVTDLQGVVPRDVRYADTLLLTDPAIHCVEARFGETNLMQDGFVMFFERHECNDICRAAKLPAGMPESLRALL
jgi:hypothetical protein